MARPAFLMAVFVVLQSCLVEASGRFMLGFLDYFSNDNRNFSGKCCNGVEDSVGKCQDPCDLLFQVTVTGLMGLNTTTQRLSETPINSTSQSKTPFQQLSDDYTNPIGFMFDEWPTHAEVTVTVEIYHVDKIHVDKMELVDRVNLSVTPQTPSNIYTPEVLIGSRQDQPFRLNVVYRFDCNENSLEGETCVGKLNQSSCPGVTPLSSESSGGTMSLGSFIDESAFGATVISSTVKHSSADLTPATEIEFRPTPTVSEGTSVELLTSFVWKTPLAWETILWESLATSEPDLEASGLQSDFFSETDFTLETSSRASSETWLSVYPSATFSTRLLNTQHRTETSVARESSSIFTKTTSPTSTENLHSDMFVPTSTSTLTKLEKPSPPTVIIDGNINRTAPLVVKKSEDEPMQFWEAILGCVLGGLALLAIFGFLFYLRKQRAMLKRQEIYTVTPRLVSEVEENGTAGRSDIPVQTAES